MKTPNRLRLHEIITISNKQIAQKQGSNLQSMYTNIKVHFQKPKLPT